jgi:hypothetical protein
MVPLNYFMCSVTCTTEKSFLLEKIRFFLFQVFDLQFSQKLLPVFNNSVLIRIQIWTFFRIRSQTKLTDTGNNTKIKLQRKTSAKFVQLQYVLRSCYMKQSSVMRNINGNKNSLKFVWAVGFNLQTSQIIPIKLKYLTNFYVSDLSRINIWKRSLGKFS